MTTLVVAQLGGRPVIVSGDIDSIVRVWDLVTGAPIGQPLATGHGGSVEQLAVVELDGRLVIVTGGFDQTVRVWDLATGTPVGQVLTGEADGTPVAPAPGGVWLV